jgi:N-methylhydantoinase A
VTNAIGCATTDLRQDYSRTLNVVLDDSGLDVVADVLRDQRDAGDAFVAQIDGNGRSDPAYIIEFELQYVGQTHTVTVAMPAGVLDRSVIETAFQREYGKWRGIALDGVLINVRTVRTILIIPRKAATQPPSSHTAPRRVDAKALRRQSVHIGGHDETVAVFERDLLRPGDTFSGPALISQLDSTVWLSPGSTAHVESTEALLIQLDA